MFASNRLAAFLVAYLSLSFVAVPEIAAQSGELRFADLAECPLESGEVIRGCTIGYRTFGTLDDDGSNAVLFPTWGALGTSEDLAQYIGPERFVDDSEFFVIAVDAFGNGVSSSPSNSAEQPGSAFPRFTIRDMVNAQHRLLTEVLEIERLRGVVGISLGAYQAFEWLVSHPAAVEKVVPIVGSPRLSSYDLLLVRAQLRILEQCREAGCAAPGGLFQLILDLVLRTPEYVENRMSPEDVEEHVRSRVAGSAESFEIDDAISQLAAELRHDVAASPGGSLQGAAEVARADLLTVVSTRDRTVRPDPARRFTERVGGRLVELDSPCGHLVFACEAEHIGALVREFLRAEVAARP